MTSRGWWLGAFAGSAGAVLFVACGGGGSTVAGASGAGASSAGGAGGAGSTASSAGPGGRAVTAGGGRASTTTSGGGGEAGGDAGPPACTPNGAGGEGGANALCYSAACPIPARSMQENRDRLIADLAQRKCTDSCTLWAALNQAERYVFLMVTTYLEATDSLLYPPAYENKETALDHAVALYTINGPLAGQGTDGSGRGGNDYNRIYLGFDTLGECVMRNFPIANPAHTPLYNMWVKSDDLAGPHFPFTQREMIFWYKAIYDLQSNGPQFHHFAKDSDFNQAGIDTRLGVCGVTDRSLTELTIAFDFYHNSDPLGDYAGMGGYGWQIVSQYDDVPANWSYMPTSCPVTAPVNTDPYGGTFAGMGPTLVNGVCTSPTLGDAGC
jgi:hypothetical protein